MKKSKVVGLEFGREWSMSLDGDKVGGVFYQFVVRFENGDEGSVSFRSRDPWLKVGMEVEYDGPEGKYQKIKIKRPAGSGGWRGPAPAPVNEHLQCAIHALDYATQLVVSCMVEKEHIYDSAMKMKNWLMKNGGVKCA